MASKKFIYRLKVEMVDPSLDSPILKIVDLLQSESRRLNDAVYNQKALAIYVKWTSLCFLRAEIKALDKAYAGSTAIVLLDKALIVSKIETFLSQARAILDILAYCLSKSLSLGGYNQSFNEVRKRGDLPTWLADFVLSAIKFNPDFSMSKNGWLLNLVTDDSIHGKSLRDFVLHTGTINLQSIQQFDGTYLFAFQPRANDKNLYHIEDMVDNVYKGICALFKLLVQHLGPSEDSDKPSTPSN